MNKLALLLAVATLSAGVPPAAAQSGQYVVIVNPGNPIKRLSQSQLSRIYLGKIQGWDINGKIEPVVALDLPNSSPLRAKFTQEVLRKSASEAEAYWRQEIYAGRTFPPLEQTESDALTHVRTITGSIAYVSASADLKGVRVVSVRE